MDSPIVSSNIQLSAASAVITEILFVASEQTNPLSNLGELPLSATQWVKDSYIKHFSPANGSLSDTGDDVSIVDSVATISQISGRTTGFVTRCLSGATYRLDYNITWSQPSSGSLRVCYMNGTTMSSYTDYTSTDIVFTVPNNITNVILAPRQSDNGTISFSINSFTKY